MQNKSDAECRLSFSNQKKISLNALKLFPLNNNQPFNALNAQKQGEECKTSFMINLIFIDYLLACNNGENYLLSFPKVFIETMTQEFLPFKIQDLKTNPDYHLVLPYQQTGGKISYFSLDKELEEFCLNEIEIKPQMDKPLFCTERKVFLIEEVLGWFFLLVQDPSTKVKPLIS